MLRHAREVPDRGRVAHADWLDRYEAWRQANPSRAALLDRQLPENWTGVLPSFEPDAQGMATRKASGAVASDATVVQIAHSSRRGSRDIEHTGSAHDDVELEVLKAASRQRLAAGQASSTWAWSAPRRRDGVRAGTLPIMSSRMGHLLDALAHVYRVRAAASPAGQCGAPL